MTHVVVLCFTQEKKCIQRVIVKVQHSKMSHVSVGERVYLKDSDIFGDITRKTVLGVDAVSLVDDEGNTTAFFATKVESDIVS